MRAVAIKAYDDARSANRDGVLLLWQDHYLHGPSLRFYPSDRAGLLALEVARIMVDGGCIYAMWDTWQGFDWAGGSWVNKPVLERLS